MAYSNGLITAPVSSHPGTGDIQRALGVSTGDLGALCTSNKINIYAKHKPVRWGGVETPNDSHLAAMRYGLYFNSTMDLSKSYQDPYWKHNKPRGIVYNELFRQLDFNGYNHRAACPLKMTNIAIANNGAIHIDLSTIVESGSNVEIPARTLFDFADRDYVGFVLWDVTKKIGYYLVTDVFFSELFDGINPTSWHDFYQEIISSLPFSNGDLIEFFWCTNYQNTIVYDQNGDHPTFVKLTSGNSSTIALMACDSTHGHTTFNIVKLDLYTHLGFTNRNTVISGSWDQSMWNWTLNGFFTDIQCTYTWPGGYTESYPMTWRLAGDDGVTIFTVNKTLTAGNSSQYTTIQLQSGSRIYSGEKLRDDNYIVTLFLYGKLTGSNDERLFATIWYNIQDDSITYSV